MADERCDLLCLDVPRAEELRARRADAAAVADGATRAQALADQTRLTLALTLRDGGELCVCDLAWILERPQNLVSHHLRALRTAGLARFRRDGKMVMYELTAVGVALVGSVVDAAEVAA